MSSSLLPQAFAWEPVNNKFGIISGELPSVNVTFFQVNKGQAPTELKKLEKRPCNNLFWSPQGQFVVLAGLRNMNGALEFIDTKDFQVRFCVCVPPSHNPCFVDSAKIRNHI